MGPGKWVGTTLRSIWNAIRTNQNEFSHHSRGTNSPRSVREAGTKKIPTSPAVAGVQLAREWEALCGLSLCVSVDYLDRSHGFTISVEYFNRSAKIVDDQGIERQANNCSIRVELCIGRNVYPL